MKIITLIENNPDEHGQLYHEHGLSLLIEADHKRILFDTGQSGAFVENAVRLKQDLNKLDYVIISHGHYDHSGGFMKLVSTVEKLPNLIVGEEFFWPKHKRLENGSYKFNGNSFTEEYCKEQKISLLKVHEEFFPLTERIMIFHHIERKNDFEQRNGKFFVKKGIEFIPDDFEDELILGIKTEKGLVVIAGCSHAGIINIIDTIARKAKLPVYAVIGGTHLVEADEKRIQKTVAAMKDRGILLAAVSHCTGEEGICGLRREFGNRFLYNNTGNVIEI